MILLKDQNIVDVLGLLSRSLSKYLKFYQNIKGLISFDKMLKFYKDFEIFPNLIPKCKIIIIF